MMRTSSAVFLLLLMVSGPAYAGTEIIAPGNITGTGIDEVAAQFQKILDINGPAIANAYALANVAGYPFGTAYLGDFPSFMLGISLNAGLANMEALDKSKTVPQGEVPVGALNPVIFFGIGLKNGYDFLGKFMIFSSGFYQPPLNYSYAKLTKLNLLSLGGKLRKNYVEKKTILPGLLEFGGVTFSLGADLIYGIIGVEGEYDYAMKNVEVDPPGLPPPLAVNLDFKPNYSASVGWFITSVTGEALAYMHVFWIFSVYTGFGLTVQYGFFSFKLDAGGQVTTDDITYITAKGDNIVAPNIGIQSHNSYNPYFIMPEYIVGFDINLYLIRLSFETMVNLRNRKDVNLQVGLRFQL